MTVGDWAVFKHTTMIGTCIFPFPRKIEAFDGDQVLFDTKDFPRMTHVSSVISTYPGATPAKNAIELALMAWSHGDAAIQKLEKKVERARLKRLNAVIAIMKQGAPINA